jgi:AAA+ ATPase superfamily predicted ATPase
MLFNPFRPNSIVTTGMFCGRVEEVTSIEQSLRQTKNGNPQHFLLEGERGIGKSSLMLFARAIATGISRKPDGLNFIVLEIELGAYTTYIEMINKIGGAFRSELRSRTHLKTLAKTAWDFLSNWSVLGVEFKAHEHRISASEAVDDLASAFASFLKETSNVLDGVLILIDEADKPDPQATNLGEFVKSLSEKLTKKECDRVCLGLAGLPILLRRLKDGHESSLRVFEIYNLAPLSKEAAKEVVNRGLQEARIKNSFETKITESALEKIVHLSEGYPHFIQQFSYCAFDQDSDMNIDDEDVLSGAYKENGALDQLGRKYFQEMYFEKISSPDYRKVLDTMADDLDGWIQRKDIAKRSGLKDTQISNALNALKGRNIILTNPERQGEYRLPTKSFAVWIKAIGQKRDLLSNIAPM